MAKTSEFKLGMAVIYTVPEGHLAKTVRGDQETIGSVHHHEMVSFSGLVGRVDEKTGAADIVIFPPSRDPKWVTGVEYGNGDGEAQVVSGKGLLG